MKLTTLITILVGLPLLITAQSSKMDQVFLLGEEEARYEQLTSIHSQSLLEATSGDIEAALNSWLAMQQAMDAYAAQINYDINGVKVWLHVFWDADGSIAHLGFLLRPDSRLVDQNELKAFFAGFIEQYQLPVQSDRKFSHYTGAAFPTLSQRASN